MTPDLENPFSAAAKDITEDGESVILVCFEPLADEEHAILFSEGCCFFCD
jgi:hypothetical protein